MLVSLWLDGNNDLRKLSKEVGGLPRLESMTFNKHNLALYLPGKLTPSSEEKKDLPVLEWLDSLELEDQSLTEKKEKN